MLKHINWICRNILFIGLAASTAISCAKSGQPEAKKDKPDSLRGKKDTFYFGADLSYVNQILDKGGVYKEEGATVSPYKIFKDHKANLVRVRLWHHPLWTKEVYGTAGTQLYSDLKDVEKTIRLSKEQGLQVELDFHYSDIWADPGNQKIPEAWRAIKDIAVLKDSVYRYTLQTLQYLDGKGLMPEMVQLGNEINCGMLWTDAPQEFPSVNVCNGGWANLGVLLNAGIQAVRDAAASSTIKPKIILHVGGPENVEWWFDNITGAAKVTGFDVIGFSYYPLWSSVTFDKISDHISKFKSKYNREVMILETAYPWTADGNDSYGNLFGSQTPISGYPFSQAGQLSFMKALTQEVIDGGGYGIIYWEPAWITSSMKDLWGTGSSWENATFFDFSGNVISGIDYMAHKYKF